MTKIKIIKIDPLSAALDSVGMTGGAAKYKGFSKQTLKKEKKLHNDMLKKMFKDDPSLIKSFKDKKLKLPPIISKNFIKSLKKK